MSNAFHNPNAPSGPLPAFVRGPPPPTPADIAQALKSAGNSGPRFTRLPPNTAAVAMHTAQGLAAAQTVTTDAEPTDEALRQAIFDIHHGVYEVTDPEVSRTIGRGLASQRLTRAEVHDAMICGAAQRADFALDMIRIGVLPTDDMKRSIGNGRRKRLITQADLREAMEQGRRVRCRAILEQLKKGRTRPLTHDEEAALDWGIQRGLFTSADVRDAKAQNRRTRRP